MIKNGSKVKIHYKLIVDKQVIDSSKSNGPLQYEHGNNQIIPGLERALEGLKPGDTKQVHIGPDDAYGPIYPQAIIKIPRDKIKMDEVELGAQLKATDENGQLLRGVVKEIKDQLVIVDFNHPLAGKELLFEIEIVHVSKK
jgi:FKBP-type peptidyl-prolyl cis-trans isomerase 2